MGLNPLSKVFNNKNLEKLIRGPINRFSQVFCKTIQYHPIWEQTNSGQLTKDLNWNWKEWKVIKVDLMGLTSFHRWQMSQTMFLIFQTNRSRDKLEGIYGEKSLWWLSMTQMKARLNYRKQKNMNQKLMIKYGLIWWKWGQK